MAGGHGTDPHRGERKADLDYLTQLALAAADSNIAQGLRPHFLAVESLLASKDENIRRRWLPRVAAGEVAVGNALTEINNRPGELTTTLRPTPGYSGKYLLNGTKYYSTGSLYSDAIYVRAQLQDGSAKPRDDVQVQQILGEVSAGASATVASRGFDRHWCNARVLANHNPLIYRARLVGNSLLNGNHQAIQYTVGAIA